MRARILQYLLVLPVVALLFAVTACDSSDDQSDSELFIGNWNVTSVSDGDGEVALTNFTKIVIGFTSSSASITATPADGSADQVFSGSYTVNEGGNTITIQLTVQGIPVPVAASYSFSSDDAVSLTVGSATAVVLGPLFGTTFTGDVTIRVVRE